MTIRDRIIGRGLNIIHSDLHAINKTSAGSVRLVGLVGHNGAIIHSEFLTTRLVAILLHR